MAPTRATRLVVIAAALLAVAAGPAPDALAQPDPPTSSAPPSSDGTGQRSAAERTAAAQRARADAAERQAKAAAAAAKRAAQFAAAGQRVRATWESRGRPARLVGPPGEGHVGPDLVERRDVRGDVLELADEEPAAGARVRSVATRIAGDHYEVLIDARFPRHEGEGEWLAVPADKILERQDNPTGDPVACWIPSVGVFCFVRAAET